MKYFLLTLPLFFALLTSCSEETSVVSVPEPPTVVVDNSIRDTACTDAKFRLEGKIYERERKTYLWAGDDTDWHFDITDWELNECNLRYGLGRETFPALLAPKYGSIADIQLGLDDIEKCLVLFEGTTVKVYPYEIMISYEVVNEEQNGNPIMIAYCVLADLGAVYSRDYCGNTLTFGVSGYTHFDRNIWDGLDAFVLWDRETESLWWPLVDRAISGELKGFPLNKYNEALWEVMSWKQIKTDFPEARVLLPGQQQDVPERWATPHVSLFDCE